MALNIETTKETKFSGYSIKVKTGEGSLYLLIMENSRGLPIAVQLQIGKTGAAIYAWCTALARTCTMLLDAGKSINDLILELENITSDRIVQNGSVPIRSGVDGFVYALRIYQRDKRKRAVRALGI